MTLDDARQLIEYHYWARDRMLQAIAAASIEQRTRRFESSFTSVHDTAVHIYSADWVWHERWRGRRPTQHVAVEQVPDVDALAIAWAALEQQVRGLVDSLDDEGLARMYDYRLLNGAPGRSTFGEMLQHVVNHASYHRGQITTLLRQAGAAPPASTDLIDFCRTRAAAV